MSAWHRTALAPALAGLLAGTIGCARAVTVSSDGSPSVQEAVATGTVRQTGSPPYVQTRLETEQGAVVITGPLAQELARASGATARVRGRALSPEGTVPRIEAASYELLRVDGDVPVVGVLLRDDSGWLLSAAGGSQVRLADLPERLRCAAGAKVWILRSEKGTIERYGLLRPPPEEATE